MVERYTPKSGVTSASKSEDRPGRFKKGMKRLPGAGRTKGTTNKNTKLIRDAITGSGAELGMLEPIYRYKEERKALPGPGIRYKTVRVRTDEVIGWKPTGKGGLQGYLVWLGCNQPVAYAGLIGKVLPMQINAKVDHTETVVTKFEKVDFSKMSLAEKLSAMREMTGLTKALPEAKKLPSPDQYEEGEFDEVPREAAE